MTEIKLRADEARDHANDVRDTKDTAFDTLESLRNRINGLTDSFTGRSQEAFITKLDEWKTANDELLAALDGLGQFLRGAADTIEETDNQLAAQLGA